MLRRLVKSGGFQSALLDGVTGSGKTEVYFEAIAEILRREPDAQILIMLPEIALTEAVLSRFEARFGAEPALWHSGAGPKARRRTWRRFPSNGPPSWWRAAAGAGGCRRAVACVWWVF